MRLKYLVGAILSLVAAPAASALGGGSVFVDAGRGPVEVILPTGFDQDTDTPLLLVLHGLGGGAAQIEFYLGLAPFADALGYLYVRPEGTMNQSGARFWNATPACCDLFGSGVDDSGYLRDLIEEIKRVLPVDPARVHIMGWSNGGYMAHRMACDHAEVIASIASLAGPTYDDPNSCNPEDQVHVLHIHGTNDMSVEYFGGFSLGSPFPSAPQTSRIWAGKWGCSLTPDVNFPAFDLDAAVPGDETQIEQFPGCSAGGSSELWTIQGGAHGPAWTMDGKIKLFDHFQNHPKPEPGASYCTSTIHSDGRRAHLTTVGTESVAAQDLALHAHSVVSQTPGLFIGGTMMNQVPFGDGFLCTGPPIVRLPPAVPTTVGGDAYLQLDFGAPYAQLFTNGATLNFQLWFRDTAAGGSGFNLSDARSITLGP